MKKNILISVVDENFKVDYYQKPANKPLSIEVAITDIKPTTKNVTFTADIPEHIYTMLLGTHKDYDESKFHKRVSFHTLALLIEHFEKLSAAAVTQNFLSKGDNKRVILIKFIHGFQSKKNEWAGGDEGKAVTSLFQFCVCFITKGGTYYTMHDSDGRVSKGGIRLQRGFTSSDMSKEFKVVEWSQEREDFLTRVQSQFVELNKKLEGFLGDLDADKLELLMAGGLKLLN